MKLIKILMLIACISLASCNGMKNYTLNTNATIDVVKSTSQLAGIRPWPETSETEKNRPKTTLNKIDTSPYFRGALTKIPKLIKGYELNSSNDAASFKTLKNNFTFKASAVRFKFARIFKPKDSKFLSNGLEFDAVLLALDSEHYVLSIENLKVDFSRVKITKEFPVVLICIEFSTQSTKGATLKSMPLIIPYKVGSPSAIGYRGYYTRSFPKSQSKDLQFKVSEIHLKSISGKQFDAVLANNPKELPLILEALNQLVID
jgi:hypothetical protein